jgi:hypothetical protein
MAKNNWLSFPPTLLPWLGLLRLFSVSRHFDTVEVIEAESQVVLNTLTEHYFQDAFKKWQKLRECCICIERDYFELDFDQMAAPVPEIMDVCGSILIQSAFTHHGHCLFSMSSTYNKNCNTQYLKENLVVIISVTHYMHDCYCKVVV